MVWAGLVSIVGAAGASYRSKPCTSREGSNEILSAQEMRAYQVFVETPPLNQGRHEVAQRCHNAGHHDLRPWQARLELQRSFASRIHS